VIEVTATIGNGQRVTLPGGGFALRGVVFGDIKGRYRDGWFVYTSQVVEEVEQNVFKTASGNIYRVEGWFPPSKATANYTTLPHDLVLPPV
jgi:hypothetical protein